MKRTGRAFFITTALLLAAAFCFAVNAYAELIDISEITITTKEETVYTGQACDPDVLLFDGTEVSKGVDFEIDDQVCKDAGTYQRTVQGIGSYTGTQTIDYVISPRSLTETQIYVAPGYYMYSGSAIVPIIHVYYNGKHLTIGTDYKRDYSDNVNVGKCQILFKGIGNFTGEVTESFRIHYRTLASTTGFTIGMIPSKDYDGEPYKPTPRLRYLSTVLKEGKDFEYYYPDDDYTEPGQKTVGVRGLGGYSGTMTQKYTINSIPLTMGMVQFAEGPIIRLSGKGTAVNYVFEYTGSSINPAPIITYTEPLTSEIKLLAADTDYELEYEASTDVWSLEDPAAYNSKITITGLDDRYTGELEVWYKIGPAEMNGLTVEVDDQVYTGKELKPAPRVTYKGKSFDAGQFTLKYSNNTEVGTATLVLTPAEGNKNFKGSKTVNFKIKEPEPTIIAVKSVKLNTASARMLTDDSDLLPGQQEAAITLTATVSPEDAANKKVSWSSSNTAVAKVDSKGKVTGIKPGTVTITVKTADGGKTSACMIKVMRRKEYKLKEGAKYTFESRLGRDFSMDVMYQNYATNTNVSLYRTTRGRNAQKLTARKLMKNGKTCWALVRTNSTVGMRAVTERNGKNIVFGTYKETNWQAFRAYRFNDGSVQFINRGSNNAISVIDGKSVQRGEIKPEKANLDERQRWFGVVN